MLFNVCHEPPGLSYHDGSGRQVTNRGETAMIPPTVYYSRVGLELGRMVAQGQKMSPPYVAQPSTTSMQILTFLQKHFDLSIVLQFHGQCGPESERSPLSDRVERSIQPQHNAEPSAQH